VFKHTSLQQYGHEKSSPMAGIKLQCISVIIPRSRISLECLFCPNPDYQWQADSSTGFGGFRENTLGVLSAKNIAQHNKLSIKYVFKNLQHSDCFSTHLCLSGVFNKDPTVLVDGAIPTNTCILPSSLVNMPVQQQGLPTPKYVCKNIKMNKIGVK
jgi:hypothetical protein